MDGIRRLEIPSGYDEPITKIIEDNSVEDMVETRDQDFLDELVLGHNKENEMLNKRTFKVSKDKLVAAIEKNRAKHDAEYATAVTGYHKAVLEALEKRKMEVSEVCLAGPDGFIDPGDDMQTWPYLGLKGHPPSCHLDDYDAALRILSSVEDDVVELSGSEIDRYMHDQWGWKGDHARSVAMYSK